MKINKEKLDFITIATIGRSKGLRGDFYLNSLCNPIENIYKYSNFKLGKSKKPIQLEYIRKSNKKLVSKIIDINNVDEIKNLTNEKIFINKAELPILPDDEIYWHALIGMNVVNTLDEKLGKVDEVNNYGSSDILSITPTDSSIDDELRLIPFIKNKYIISFSKEENKIIVDWGIDF